MKLNLYVNHAAVKRVEACRDEDRGERVPTSELVDVHSLSSAKKHGERQNRTDKFTHTPPPGYLNRPQYRQYRRVQARRLRSNLKALADIFIDPQSVELIRNANSRGARIGIGEALARTAAETWSDTVSLVRATA
ncbi:hypothetical protein [Mesorhizobium sp. CO1-1-4]|uniref:hypothetical protein n=1 Tax=Mesorhizobium sp. CO1-1-4 TaxID=2876633 RepID=UPI001CCF9502|nr:hypothetical protein [Mesorhizobium sp. CO1-1-4]MBZ9742355.1 hypothetical protein [Mesorhizobium sp. CO1-1-4]